MDSMRPGLTIYLAVAVLGCSGPDDGGSRQSVTVQLPPARPFQAEPGFSFAINPTTGREGGQAGLPRGTYRPLSTQSGH